MSVWREILDALRGKTEDDTFKIGEKEIKKSTLVRILAGVVLVFFLYGVGVVAEIISNYKFYLESGGLSGGEMPKMNFAPYIVYAHTFTKNGLTALIGIVVVVLAITLILKYRDKVFGETDYDERGFRKVKTGTYGTADWISEAECKKALEIGTINTVKGTIYGEKDGKLYALPTETRFNRHTMIIGASGTMKSRAIIRNHLFQAIKRGESVAITDPKAELFRDMYEVFRQNGYNVKVFNLVDPMHGNTWNCMDDLHGDTLLAQMLTNIIIGNTASGKGDHFWDNGETNLLKALILYVDNNDDIPPEDKNLATVYRVLTTNGEKDLMKMFDKLPPEHAAKAPYNLFSQASDQVKSGIVLGLGTRLQVLQNEAVSRLVSTNDIDLTSLGKEKTAFFVILSDQDTTMKFLSSLFFSLLFIKLTRYADSQPNQKCAVPVNLVLDEFNNVGRIGGADDGSDFARTLSVIRSRDVRVMIAIQSLGQLQNRYPNNLWAEIIGNCDIQLMLGCTDDVTAKYISERSGEMSIQVNSTSKARRTFAMFEVIPQYRETEGQGKRMLLTKDEVLNLDPQELLVILRGYNLLKLKKYDYTNHPMSKKIRPISIYDYYADGVDYQTVEGKEAEEKKKAELEAPQATPEDSAVDKNSLEWMLGGIVDVNKTPPKICTDDEPDDEIAVTPQHTENEDAVGDILPEEEFADGIPDTAMQNMDDEENTPCEYDEDGNVIEPEEDETPQHTGFEKTQEQRRTPEGKYSSVPRNDKNRPGATPNKPIIANISKDGTKMSDF